MKTQGNRLSVLFVGFLLAVGCAADMGDSGQIQTSTEEIRCGGTTCRLANATATCHRGGCVIANCFTFNADCDHRDQNGCEVNIGTAVNNCGSCGNRCPARANATRTCTVGACGFACRPGFADCDGSPANGCEVNLQTDRNNCGACRTSCGSSMGPMGPLDVPCCAGRCTNTLFDPNNCGGCGVVCASAGPNTTPACNYPGTCGVSCTFPFTDCDRDATNGCETSVYGNDPNNCGACGLSCGPGGTCMDGRCLCAAGQFTCYDPSTGGFRCTDVSTDPNNCGSCGINCGLGGTCSAGTCSGGCAPGTADCDRNPMNGCETSVESDSSNCGACGNVCPAGMTCQGGGCTLTCMPPATACRTPFPPGLVCVDTTSDPNNCGRCGNVCPPGTRCLVGRCG